MSDAPNSEQTSTVVEPGASAPAPAAQPEAAPKWDGEFDPERAARLVANLREEAKGYKAQLAEVQARLTEYERSQMSEQERIAEEARAAQEQLVATRRELAMLKYGLPEKALKFLNGASPEEIDAQAQELAETFGVSAKSESAQEMPPTLPVPGNGSDPSAVRQLTREEAARMSPAELMEAYRAGRLRDIGGK